jgi:CRISPR/Cas system-associated exonuclease Cas4 (RecB family)
MDNHNIFLILECLVVLFILYSFIKRFVGGHKDNETLYMSEKYIGIDTPIAIHGYPDRVIKVNGALRVDDFKTRGQFKVYDSDIWQISCYKYILRRTQKLPVLEESKVVIKNGKQTKEFVIRLKSDEEIEKLYAKYTAILNNEKKPTLCNNKRFCAKCPYYQDKCFPNV